jgi:hypothetical protein
MAKQLQLRRGSTTEHASFTGAAGEVTVDTDKDTVVVHDNSTAGGKPLATEANVALKAPKASPTFTGTATFSGDLVPSTPMSNRNIVINGAMQVAQRGSTSHASSTDKYGAVDRFKIYNTGGSPAFTTTQDTGVPTGQGFASSLKLDLTVSDTGLTATDRAEITMHIEGQDLQHLKKGTANAEAVTLSFWVNSPKTGVHIVELYDADNARRISKSYTIAGVDTWQKVEVTFEGDTTGAFDNDNSSSMTIRWWLFAGSNYNSGTLGTTWTTSVDANRAVGQVNCCDSTSNNFFLTGVQLELGSNATPFEHRSYGDELLRCQRYFQRHNQPKIIATGTTSINAVFNMVPEMRGRPGVGLSGTLKISDLTTNDKTSSTAPGVITTDPPSSGADDIVGTVVRISQGGYSGLTTSSMSNTVNYLVRPDTNAHFQLDAEL